jgi:hypothetical protein
MNSFIKMLKKVFNVNGAVICISIIVLSLLSIKIYNTKK